MIGNEKGLEEFWSQRIGWVTLDIGVHIRSILKNAWDTAVVLIANLNIVFGILGL
jgi:hypothetical protein